MTIEQLKVKLDEVRNAKAEAIKRLNEILTAADAESRALTTEEETEWATLDKTTIPGLRADEERLETLLKAEIEAAEPDDEIKIPFIAKRDNTPDEFRNFGEFVYSARYRPNDPRLQFQEHEHDRTELREQSMSVGSEGGYMVPSQFIPTLLQVTPDEATFRPRSTVIPAGTPPDAAVTMPALAQGAAENVYGGMTVNWIAEGGAKPETDMEIRDITLTPNEVAAYVVVTDKLLRNWPAADATITRLMRLAIRGAEDTAFLSGSGAGRPLGIINSPARIDIARTTANQIAFADVIAMYARLKFGGSPIWIGSQTILPQLMQMVDAGNNSVWLPGGTSGAANPPPGSLYGIPLRLADRSPGLGSTADLVLADLAYYLIKDGSGPFVAASPHVYFTNNKTVLKVFWNVDGQPWLDEPLPLEGSTANTVSPFVILN